MRTLMKQGYLIIALTILAALSFSAIASAETLVVDDKSWGYSAYVYSSARTGQTGTVEYDLLIDDMEKTGYCVELDKSMTGASTWSIDVGGLDSTKFLEAAWVLKTFAPGLDNAIADGMTVKSTVTAVQLAIWEIMYETQSSYSIYSGAFDVAYVYSNSSYTRSKIMSTAQSYLNQVALASAGLDASQFAGYGIAESNAQQNLIFGGASTPGGAVPEPASMLLFGSALGVGGWFRRRSQKKKEPKKA